LKAHIDFLLVINSNLPPILHRFRDIAFDRSKIAIFSHPSRLTPTEGFFWDDLRKILPGCLSLTLTLPLNPAEGSASPAESRYYRHAPGAIPHCLLLGLSLLPRHLIPGIVIIHYCGALQTCGTSAAAAVVC